MTKDFLGYEWCIFMVQRKVSCTWFIYRNFWCTIFSWFHSPNLCFIYVFHISLLVRLTIPIKTMQIRSYREHSLISFQWSAFFTTKKKEKM